MAEENQSLKQEQALCEWCEKPTDEGWHKNGICVVKQRTQTEFRQQPGRIEM
ncbi:MAG: hypothetical protein Q8O93_04585 [bacterium]|nr:hypothetical protein [bacterium]